MISFSTSWPPRQWTTGRRAGPGQKILGVLLFLLALGVMAIGAVVGVILLAIGVVAASFSALALAVRRSLGGGNRRSGVPAPPRHSSQPGSATADTRPRSQLVIDIESVQVRDERGDGR